MKNRTARSIALPQATLPRWLPWLMLAAGLAVAEHGHALYKVVGPDGKVTYTDRMPTEGKVSPIGGAAPAPAPEVAAMPIELRQATSRYPVTLYTTTGACEPCDAARQLLRQRGVPYAEKQVMSPEDGDALQRLSGGRDVPMLSIGAQMLRGLAADVWNQYLDSAGYPRESKLPAGYQYPAPTPITERREATAEAPRPAQQPPTAPAPSDATPVPPPPAPGGIRF